MKSENTDTVFMTTDKQVFLDKNLADDHALRLNGQKRKRPLKVIPITKEMLRAEQKNGESESEKSKSKTDRKNKK